MAHPDHVLGTVLPLFGSGVWVGDWLRGRRDDRDFQVLLDRRRRYALQVRGVPPLDDPDGGRRAD